MLDLEKGRWSCNSQPSLKEIREILARLPVKEARADHAYLVIKFSRPLTGAEGYILGQLGQDEPETLNDGDEVSLWWD